MKVIFLDIDGVLNSHQWSMMHYRKERECIFVGPEHFCPVAMSNLVDLVESGDDIRIVISSSWRHRPLDEFRGMFQVYGIQGDRVIGSTPWLTGQRGDEIKAWLDAHPDVTAFVVIDDDGDMDAVRANFVQTDGLHGFMRRDAMKAAELLGTKIR